MSVLPLPHSLEDTVLFRRLKEESAAAGRSELAGNVLAICRYASDRLRLFQALHQQFTLHDDVHCLRVVSLMGAVTTGTTARLNDVELALLILSAYLHDQGMIVAANELPAITASTEWQIHSDQWNIDHPNCAELQQRLQDPYLVGPERDRVLRRLGELDAARFTDFIRRSHGERSAAFIVEQYGADPRLTIAGRSVAPLLAMICRSHVFSPDAIAEGNGFRLDEHVGTLTVNVAFIAIVLRLADILDFDRERTPDSLYRAIDFSSDVSLTEWEKHRSVVGWSVGSERILFAAECQHPAYERAIRRFVEWIDEELVAAREWSRRLPKSHEGYAIGIPVRVDVSHVGARIDAITGRPSYLYADLEFGLARDELVKLLMTDRLYTATGLFVRELLQNALDALRHRRALFQAEGSQPPELRVKLEHFEDASGYEVVRCMDNGIGMDTVVVTKFLTRAGRSFYRSPDFDQERAKFRSKGCDFDPCARFGIGFLSCFMFGDDITIHSRKDGGPKGGHGDPIVVQITGLSGIVAIRPGPPDQAIGTTVEVRARRKSVVIDDWDDRVRLVPVVRGYALATEFPITVDCRLPGIAKSFEVPTVFSARPHPVETVDVTRRRVFRVSLQDTHPQLRGEIRFCALTDDDGRPCTGNAEAQLVRNGEPAKNHPVEVELRTSSRTFALHPHDYEHTQVCADGILVAGDPGRTEREHLLGNYSAPVVCSGASLLVDTRGAMKPELTPARTPPDRSFDLDRSWRRLNEAVGRAYGLMVLDVLNAIDGRKNPGLFWEVVEAYGLDIDGLAVRDAFNALPVLVKEGNEALIWTTIAELRSPTLTWASAPSAADLRPTFGVAAGGSLLMPEGVARFRRSETGYARTGIVERFVIASSIVDSVGPLELSLRPTPHSGPESLEELGMGNRTSLQLARFGGALEKHVRVAGTAALINSASPVVERVRQLVGLRMDERSGLDQFLATLVFGWPKVPAGQPVEATSWESRTRRKLAQLYRTIDWTSVAAELSPPYKAFVPGHGVDTIGVGELTSWRT